MNEPQGGNFMALDKTHNLSLSLGFLICQMGIGS